jgi:hypothetical protein
VTPFVTAGAGFLLAVLWFDLMFDVQGERGVASTAAYYARVTTGARPMNRLVATVMVATLAAVVVQLAQREDPAWVAWASLALLACAIGVAGARTVPAAVRLGTQRDPAPVQAQLARGILRQHLFCFAAVTAVLVLQLAFAA